MNLEELELLSLLLPLVGGLGGGIFFMLRGFSSLKWTGPALLLVMLLDWRILEAAGAKDPEAGAFGLVFVSMSVFFALILLLIGVGLRGVRMNLRTAVRREQR